MSKSVFAAFVCVSLLALQPPALHAEDTVQAVQNSETKKAKRPLTEKQKLNIATMRACGAEWRSAKAAGTVKGQKWRDYLKECRKRKKEAA